MIKTGHSLSRILNYNEHKVKECTASAIHAVNYPMDIEQLSFANKLRHQLHIPLQTEPLIPLKLSHLPIALQ